MNKAFISTDKAPAAIGTYSQAVKVGTAVYLSGQIPLVPETDGKSYQKTLRSKHTKYLKILLRYVKKQVVKFKTSKSEYLPYRLI